MSQIARIQKLQEAAKIAVVCGYSMEEFLLESKIAIADAALGLTRGNMSRAARELRCDFKTVKRNKGSR